MPEYTPRIVDRQLDTLLTDIAAVAIEGAKGVGKTATAKRRARTVVNLDDAVEAGIVAADPRLALQRPTPILFDEWQRAPAIWDAIRRAVDDDDSSNQFLLTGSTALDGPNTHSGAGRIVRIRMRPQALSERGVTTPTVSLETLLRGKRGPLQGSSALTLADYAAEIVASGFPGIRRRQGPARIAHLDGYIARIVDRDFAEAGHKVRRPETLLAWLRAYAAATATSARFETIRDAATSDIADKPAKRSSEIYRDVLARLSVLDPVPAWLPSHNPLAELTQAPKHHLVDPALAARLLGADESALLTGSARPNADGHLLGPLFESLVTLSVRVYAPLAAASVHHLRTARSRREIDLIVRGPDHRVVAIAVKLGGVVSDDDVRQLHWLRAQIGDELADAIVVNTGPQAYRRADGIGVVPAALLGA